MDRRLFLHIVEAHGISWTLNGNQMRGKDRRRGTRHQDLAEFLLADRSLHVTPQSFPMANSAQYGLATYAVRRRLVYRKTSG